MAKTCRDSTCNKINSSTNNDKLTTHGHPLKEKALPPLTKLLVHQEWYLLNWLDLLQLFQLQAGVVKCQDQEPI
jgi:hypothetical protein